MQKKSTYLLLLFLMIGFKAIGQPVIIKDYNTLMEIPDIVTIESSPAHIYVLSESEGLAVFRTATDTLQWLYTSPNMQRRGNQINADIRFAYLYRDNSDLFTVLEPTSLLGVYSSTTLPYQPLDAARLDNYVYIAFGERGLGRLSLESPETVDSEPEILLQDESNPNIISLTSDANRLFALDEARRIHYFIFDGEELIKQTPIRLQHAISEIKLIDNVLYGYTSNGEFYRIGTERSMRRLFSINRPVSSFDYWNNHFVIRDDNKHIWLADSDFNTTKFRDNSSSLNLFTVSKNNLWMTEFDQLSLLLLRDDVAGAPELDESEFQEERDTTTSKLKLVEIDDVILPFPRALILPINTTEPFSPDEIRFQTRSQLDNIQVRNHGLFWQPSSRDVGHHRITLIASTRDGQTDSTSFQVEIRPFNAPPRFSPVRKLSIPVNEKFELPIRAKDPDGTDPNLIRYIGIDLPDGAEIDERSGDFVWTPHRRQVGEHKFDVIATDQYGAAASLTVTINVVSLGRDS